MLFHKLIAMKSVYISLFFIVFLLSQSVYAVNSMNKFVSSSEIYNNTSLPVFHTNLIIDVHKLSPEINSTSCEYPICFSEINTGLIYFVEYKNSKNAAGTKDFFFSRYDSIKLLWEKPINISKEYLKFCEENKIMKFKELYVTIDNDIYLINLKNKEFSLQKLNINTRYIESGPCLSHDGNTLYFVSDRKGSFGGRDIYASERLSDGKWSEPYNLGKEVNTNDDEESPFIMLDGVTLCYSSKGHNSYGGYDIYTSTQDAEGMWSKPENLGAPVNSTSDDYYYITDPFGERAYYSSDKLEKGNQDIFYVY